MEATRTAMQEPYIEDNGETVGIDKISKQLLLDVVREAKAMNEVEIEKSTLSTRRRSAVFEMREFQNIRNSSELTDDELLNAFAFFPDKN